ncbi:hypothetical protein SAMN04487996_12813 [Dyadobacter soli]|uniref:CDP-Glycerol:Poly(Glycerophosphate) glycerophosphotransferase n=1 Tax=Dyadobacter soli TaxID=659014 RepID=A0A1G7ZFA2_9BACT|nr:hypothetical protein [Dyadobacter soli]SDH07319.1 hypothetical protein SAMN04487996_12813 [Dyadobacter soli]
MERTDQKRILLLITNPFAVINMIHSGVTAELCTHYGIYVMSNLLTCADIEHFNRHFRSNMHWLPTPLPEISRITKWLRAGQMLLFGHFFQIETIRIKVHEKSTFFHWLFSITQKSPLLIHLSGLLLVVTRNWLIRRTKHPGLRGLAADYNFQTVISTSPLDLRENAIVNSLQMHGIPGISIIISWDNLTSKGVINTQSDRVLVWNNQMASEYHRFYAIFGDNAVVRIAGIPRFDIYRRPPAQSLHFNNISKTDRPSRLILFSTGAIKHHSCQNYIIRDLLEYTENRPDITILIRCHPGDDARRYDCFRGIKNLHFFQPFGKSRIPPVDYLEILHSQLSRCDVCLQVASTMLLDAAAANKPCISIAYDARPEVDYAHSVKRFYDYSHQLSLPDRLKNHIVYDRWQLFEKLDEMLGESYASNGIRNAVEPIIHCCSPESVHLTTQYIREWLG